MPSRFQVPALVVGVFAMVAAVTAAPADERAAIARGTAGLTRLPFTAENRAAEPIACGITTAHWYSVDLGRAAPGGSVQADLWASVSDGAVFVLNAHEDRMPVQALWCGIAGRAWITRSAVTLERRAGAVPRPLTLACADGAERLDCR